MKATVTKNNGAPVQMNLDPLKRMALSMLQPTTALLVLYGEKGWLPYRMNSGNAFAQIMTMASVVDGITADHGDIVEYSDLHSIPYYHKKMAEIVNKYSNLQSILKMWDMRTDAYSAEFGEISPFMPNIVYYAPDNYFGKLFFITSVIWDAYENGTLTTSASQTLYVLSFIELATRLFDQANDAINNSNCAKAEEAVILLHHAQHLLNSFYAIFSDANNDANSAIITVCGLYPNGWVTEFRDFDRTVNLLDYALQATVEEEFENFDQTVTPAAPAAPAACTVPSIYDL